MALLGRRTTKQMADGDSLGVPERPPSPSLSVASDLGEPTKRNQGDEELRCVIAVLRHGEHFFSYMIFTRRYVSISFTPSFYVVYFHVSTGPLHFTKKFKIGETNNLKPI